MSEVTIWSFFKKKGLSDCGVAGLMGNLYAESGLKSTNLQNTYEKKLGMSDTLRLTPESIRILFTTAPATALLSGRSGAESRIFSLLL